MLDRVRTAVEVAWWFNASGVEVQWVNAAGQNADWGTPPLPPPIVPIPPMPCTHMAFSEWVNASGEATTWVSSNEMPAWWIPLVPGTGARAGWADWANADGEIVYWRNVSQQRVRWGWPHACVLVMATRIGQIKEQMLRPGDVFWCDAELYSETSFDYGFGRAGAPVFGWMQLVPQSTPLTVLSHQALPWFDFQAPRRRTVF